jgi:hypothetical protein
VAADGFRLGEPRPAILGSRPSSGEEIFENRFMLTRMDDRRINRRNSSFLV